MSAIIAIICYDKESRPLLLYSYASIKEFKEIKRQYISYIDFPNRIAARDYAAENLIVERHMTKERVKLLRTGKLHEFKVMDQLDISIRTGSEMKSFIDYYNKLP